METARPKNMNEIEKIFFDLSEGKLNPTNYLKIQFSYENIAYAIIGFVLVILAITVLIYAVLYLIHIIRTLIDKSNKRTTFLQVSFSDKVNYSDARYLQTIDNLFKRIEQIIRTGGHTVSFEVHKRNGIISFLVSGSNPAILESIKSQLLPIEGVKSKVLKKDDVDFQITSISSQYKTKKVFYKPDMMPISFKTQNVFSDIVKSLEHSHADSGCIIIIRSSKARNRLISKKRHFDRLSKDIKRNDQYINQENAKYIEEKINHGELMNVKAFVYSDNSSDVSNLVSCFAQSSVNDEIRQSNVFLPSEKTNLSKRYITPEFVPLRLILGYSYLSSFELAHIFRPVFSEQMILMDQNIVSIPKKGSDDLLLLNNKGDSITIENGKNGIGIFGDKGSGKTSGALGNLLISSFNNGEGALFTVYKEEEVYPILKLAKQNNRLDDIILLNQDSVWRTNIINEELRQTRSIDNAIDLMIKINDYANKNEGVDIGKNKFFEAEGRELFNNIVTLCIFLHDKFSLSVMEHIGGLMREQAHYIDSQGKANITPEQIELYKARQIQSKTFDKILELVETKDYGESEKRVFNFTDKDVKKCVKYFKFDWLGTHPETRDGIYKTFQSNIRGLTKGVISQLLLADVDESYSHFFKFGDTRKGKIIILDEPVSSKGIEGKTFQKIIKSFWVNEIKRSKDFEGTPCNLISDEFQEFVTEDDIDFLNVCRSYGVGIIWATQNVATLEAKLGLQKTKQLLANTQVKIFHQSSDPLTWKYGRDLLGEVDSNNYTEQYNEKLSTSITSSQKFELLGKHFQQLSMNLPASQTEAIIFNRGYNFEDGKLRYLEVIFNKVDRVFKNEIESLIPEYDGVNLEEFDAEIYIKNILQTSEISESVLEIKKVEKKTPKANKKVEKKEEESSTHEDRYLTIDECVNLYNLSERKIRSLIKAHNVETKESQSENKRTIKLISKKGLDLVVTNTQKISITPLQI
jgi:hypothetical protein